jgi:hypothetical protein
MSTFLIVLLSVVGFLALAVGGLIFLWFHQGGCCVRRLKQKINRQATIQPVIKNAPGADNA